MLKNVLEEGYLFWAAGIISMIAVLIRFFLSIGYSSLVRDSRSIDKESSESIEKLKKKFETRYQMKLGVKNVDIFVEKYISMKKVCGLYLSTWESVSGQARVLCAVIGIGAGMIGTYYQCGQVVILSTISVCIGGIAVTLFVDNFSGLQAKKQRLKVNMSDYFENYLEVRLEFADEGMEDVASTIENGYDAFEDYGYNTYVNKKLEKAENKFLAKKLKLEKKEQNKKLKKEKKEIFAKVKKEKGIDSEEIRLIQEQEALEEMRKRRAQKQKERKERALEEMRRITEEKDEPLLEEKVQEDDVQEERDSKYSAEAENKIIEEVLKEFLV